VDKFLLFTTGGGSTDPINWNSSEAALYSVKDLKSIKPTSSSTVGLFFETQDGREVVTLTVVNGFHSNVIKSIISAISFNDQALISVADVDGNKFINKNIKGVSIKAHTNHIQSLTGNSRTKLTVPRGNWSSCMIANIDGSDAVNLTLELYDGTTYTALLSTISIPADNTLKLEGNEISFDNSTYVLYATSGDAGGQLTFTFSY
tara:strand:+ start:128 stop:739 length:612 start_codon:yes stop_codon:yes gene_type:complete